MSSIYGWEYKECFQNNRQKIIQLIYSEIIFLGNCLHKAAKRKIRKSINKALKKLSRLLDKQQIMKDSNITENDYYDLINTIYLTIAGVVKKLD